MYDRSGDGTGSSEVKIRTNTAKFTDNVFSESILLDGSPSFQLAFYSSSASRTVTDGLTVLPVTC